MPFEPLNQNSPVLLLLEILKTDSRLPFAALAHARQPSGRLLRDGITYHPIPKEAYLAAKTDIRCALLSIFLVISLGMAEIASILELICFIRLEIVCEQALYTSSTQPNSPIVVLAIYETLRLF